MRRSPGTLLVERIRSQFGYGFGFGLGETVLGSTSFRSNENKIAIRNADALRYIARSPILLRASSARPVVNGKYKSARKK